MKVFNLTDVATEKLKQYQLVDKLLVIGRSAVAPGESIDLPAEPHILSQLDGYIKLGAMCRDSLPAEYLQTKSGKAPVVPAPAVETAPTVVSVPSHPVSKRGKKRG